MTITLDEVRVKIDGALVHDAERCRVEQRAAGASVLSDLLPLPPLTRQSATAARDEMELE